ncbi:hypothetical protein ACFSSE_12415 [Pedobacter alpinus]|uniref:Uncharacterized protein n=1 Tax=Pedobacter alpinus TaxID=1590643 RepID=A0ABW5TTB5_9SPHI
MLKHIRNISYKSIVEQWSDNLCYK